MNGVYFPVQVAVLLRRLVNVISGLSISNQYMLLKQARAEEVELGASRDSAPALSSWATLDALKSVEWSWWSWPRSAPLDSLSETQSVKGTLTVFSSRLMN